MMRIRSAAQVAYAVMIVTIGVLCILHGDFAVTWQGVPKGVPGREVLVYLCALVSVGAGLGLLWRASQPLAARTLLTLFLAWIVLWRIRGLFGPSLIGGTWAAGNTMAMTAGAWCLFVAFATDWDRHYFGFATGPGGLRIARTLYALGLIPFGYAHFAAVDATAPLIPGWLPWHVGLAYLTGATFIAASVGILTGRYARLAAALSALQMVLFGLIVWVPRVISGSLNAFQWGEFWTTFALAAAGWVVADSFVHRDEASD